MDAQDVRQFSQESLLKGELVPMPPKSLELGGISTNVALSLGLYVRENQKGRIYLPYTAFKVG